MVYNVSYTDDEKWLVTHEDITPEEEDIIRWQWCGLFKTRESALKLLKKNIKRIIDEYDETFPEIFIDDDHDTREVTVTIGRCQRFRIIKLIEEP